MRAARGMDHAQAILCSDISSASAAGTFSEEAAVFARAAEPGRRWRKGEGERRRKKAGEEEDGSELRGQTSGKQRQQGANERRRLRARGRRARYSGGSKWDS